MTAPLDLSGLEPDAREVVRLIVERASMGRKLYRDLDLDTDPRDWLSEAIAEAIDHALAECVRAALLAKKSGAAAGTKYQNRSTDMAMCSEITNEPCTCRGAVVKAIYLTRARLLAAGATEQRMGLLA